MKSYSTMQPTVINHPELVKLANEQLSGGLFHGAKTGFKENGLTGILSGARRGMRAAEANKVAKGFEDQGFQFKRDTYGTPTGVDFGGTTKTMLGNIGNKVLDTGKLVHDQLPGVAQGKLSGILEKLAPYKDQIGIGLGAASVGGLGLLGVMGLRKLLSSNKPQYPYPPQYMYPPPVYSGTPQAIQKYASLQDDVDLFLKIAKV